MINEHQIPITRMDMDMLIALFEVQPATTRLVAITSGWSEASSHDRLRQMMPRGLVVRRRAPRQPRLTPAERKKLQGSRSSTSGRRPFLYSLTTHGRNAAKTLIAVREAINSTEYAQTPTAPGLESLPVTVAGAIASIGGNR